MAPISRILKTSCLSLLLAGVATSMATGPYLERSVTVHFINNSNFTLTVVNAGLASKEGKWDSAPPAHIAPHTTVTWKSQSSNFLRGVEGAATYRIEGFVGTAPSVGLPPPLAPLAKSLLAVSWDNPEVGNNTFNCTAPAPLKLEKSGGSGNDSTVTFTLWPVFELPAHQQITSLKVRVLTGQDQGAGTDDKIYFDVGPVGWNLPQSKGKFERNSDDTFDLSLSGVSLSTDDISRLRIQKKGVGGWTGAPDGVGGPWECQSIHLIVNKVDLGPIEINKWLQHGSPEAVVNIGNYSVPDRFVRTLRMTANPELSAGGEESGAVFTTLGKLAGLSGWQMANVGYVYATGTVVYTPGQSSDGCATIDLKLEKIEIFDEAHGYHPTGKDVAILFAGKLHYDYTFSPIGTPYTKVFSGPGADTSINGPRYLRAEYFWRTYGAQTGGSPLPAAGTRVQLRGPIFIDTDKEGYYEVHPQSPTEVIFPYKG